MFIAFFPYWNQLICWTLSSTFHQQTFFFWFLSLLQTLWLQTVVINRYKKYYSLCSRLWMNVKDIATQINNLFDKKQTLFFYFYVCNSKSVLGLEWFEKLQVFHVKKLNANKNITRFLDFIVCILIYFFVITFLHVEIKQNCNSSETVAIFFSDVVFERNRGKKDVRGIALLDLKLFACDDLLSKILDKNCQ